MSQLKNKNAAFHQKQMKGNLLNEKKKSRAAFSDVSPNDRSVKSLKWAFFFLKYDIMWISVAYVPHTPTPNSVQT